MVRPPPGGRGGHDLLQQPGLPADAARRAGVDAVGREFRAALGRRRDLQPQASGGIADLHGARRPPGRAGRIGRAGQSAQQDGRGAAHFAGPIGQRLVEQRFVA